MTRVTTQQIEEARQIDLLSYFEKYRSDDLVRISAREYCTVEHDSLKMSHGMWMWWSRKIGGKSALDYLIKAEGHNFVDAVNKLTGGFTKEEINNMRHDNKCLTRELVLPEKNGDNRRVFAYLRRRVIADKYRTKDDVALFNIDPMELEDEENATE